MLCNNIMYSRSKGLKTNCCKCPQRNKNNSNRSQVQGSICKHTKYFFRYLFILAQNCLFHTQFRNDDLLISIVKDILFGAIAVCREYKPTRNMMEESRRMKKRRWSSFWLLSSSLPTHMDRG